jgi:galactokinase
VTQFEAWAPGRVNLIGDHTDYTGGLVMPMAIQLGIRLTGTLTPGRLSATSADAEGTLDIELPLTNDQLASVMPDWGRTVAAVAAELGTAVGFDGTFTSTLPLGSGLSSSAALEVATAVALTLVDPFDPAAIAHLARDAEEAASGVPCGIMDQLASAAGIDGAALLIDCTSGDIHPVSITPTAQFVVVHSEVARQLASSEYATRRQQCEAAEAIIGPLRTAELADVVHLRDPILAARARHVITENLRVLDFASALSDGDLEHAGAVMTASHRSLASDFEVSIPELDSLVERLDSTPGVYGARLTGAGFGGCVVALCAPGVTPAPPGHRWWPVTPSPGAWATATN